MKVSPGGRRKARHYGMQALYQWQMTGADPKVIEAEFIADYDMTHVDREYFHELVHNIPLQFEMLDESYTHYLQTRSLAELDPITLALIRIAAYELKQRIDVPYRVVITESVSLAKKFGAADSYKFINGVLDRLAGELRQPEVQAHASD
jgi:transcription antitermination protein NusB